MNNILETEQLQHLDGHVEIKEEDAVVRIYPVDAYATELIGEGQFLEFLKA